MKKLSYIILCGVLTFGCEIDEQINPNAPAVENIAEGATETDLNNLVTGVLARMRNSYSIYATATGTITRELYLFDADPRNTTDLIGTEGSLDNDSFYTTANWINRYRTIKNCNILLESLPAAAESVSAAEKNGYSGFAKTMIAHQFLILWGAYFDSGIRLDVEDPDNFGPLVTNEGQVLQFVRDLLDEANTELNGAEFSMVFTSGFAGFDTPSTFAQFNRALAARAALYAGDNASALTHLNDSFFDISGDLSIGPKMIFSTTGGDLLNDLFKTPGQNGNQIFASDTWVSEAQAGDLRVQNKVTQRAAPFTKSGIMVNYETNLYTTSTSPIDIIRNEELMLIYAEANIGTNNTEALAGINAVRSAAGLPDLVGTVTVQDVLVERRYSLWGEAHRMVDLRRTGNLTETYITLDPVTTTDEDGNVIPATQEIFNQFPVPLDEVGN
ncbi:RagB/SusD family nutrient uptake outer membrane protein [Ekhidna sp.]|uniref:RagB/SusD family nutrient uptake outer membrane protein n=1 Tax=Ekhidna sp. TaxID=2608089 RepID=UPI003BABD094